MREGVRAAEPIGVEEEGVVRAWRQDQGGPSGGLDLRRGQFPTQSNLLSVSEQEGHGPPAPATRPRRLGRVRKAHGGGAERES